MVKETPNIGTETPKVSKVKKQETNKNDTVMQIQKNKIQNNQHSPTSALKLKRVDSDLKEQKNKEQTKIADDTNFKWNNKEMKPYIANKKVDLPGVTKKSPKKSPEIEVIKYEEQYHDDTEIIQNTPIKIEKNDTLVEIKMEKEKGKIRSKC